MLLCVVVCCSAVSTNLPRMLGLICGKRPALQYVAVYCSALQCVAVRYGVLQCVAVCCSAVCTHLPKMLGLICGKKPALQYVAVRCSVLQCVAVLFPHICQEC